MTGFDTVSMGKPKLTYELVEKAVAMKRDGLSNCDIIAALGIHQSTFYRWVGNPRTKVQRALSEQLKKAETEYKQTLLTTIRKAALEKTGHWTAAAWLLERKYPEEYSQNRRAADESREAAPQIVLGVTVAPAKSDAGGETGAAGGLDG